MTNSPSGTDAEVAHGTDRLGVIETGGGSARLRYERLLTHPPERVWRALTESDQLREWMPCDFVGERRAGAELRTPFWPDVAEKHGLDGADLTGRILVWEPHRVFELQWDTERLRYELEPTGDGHTVLTLSVDLGSDDEREVETWRAAAGYHTCLDALTDLLDDVARPTLMERDTSPLEERYRLALETRES